MTSLPLLFGYLGCVLLAAALASRLARRWTLSPSARVAVASGCAAAMLVPLDGLPLAGYLRGIIGDLSIVTQAMLAACIFSHVLDRRLLDRREMGAIMAAAFAGGLFLYPAALGLMHFDPYALGFGSPYLAATLAALTLVASYLRLYWLAACLLVAVSARLADALESQNLWDYLLDPLLALYAGFWLSRALMRRITPARLNLGERADAAEPFLHGQRGASYRLHVSIASDARGGCGSVRPAGRAAGEAGGCRAGRLRGRGRLGDR